MDVDQVRGQIERLRRMSESLRKLGSGNIEQESADTLDALLAECRQWSELNHAIRTERDSLLAENERLRKDAERYRFLRDPKAPVPWGMYCECAPEDLDAAIDAAMEKEKEKRDE